MQATLLNTDTNRYARCIEVSRRIRWEIDRDVICGRTFDFNDHFLPEGLSLVGELGFLDDAQRRLASQIQGRTYANVFGLVERFINAKILELSRDHWLGDQVALEALVRFSEEEIKHQELFRRIEALCARGMVPGYQFLPDPNEVATAVLASSTWAVLGLTCHIELFTQAHYRKSIEPHAELSPLFKDVFLFHWREESQHAILDELEWRREHAKLTRAEIDSAVNDLIALIGAVDNILTVQSEADATYFGQVCGQALNAYQTERVHAGFLKAYRWQYIISGVQEPRFVEILESLITPAQGNRIHSALLPLMQ